VHSSCVGYIWVISSKPERVGKGQLTGHVGLALCRHRRRHRLHMAPAVIRLSGACQFQTAAHDGVAAARERLLDSVIQLSFTTST
jgi:hypothetical protein